MRTYQMIITIFTCKNSKNAIFKQKIGQESENKELTDRQRNVLKKLLMDKGFLPKNINIQSVGEEHLAVHDNSDINRRINSRVLMEIKYVDGTGR
jgi:outer membrane protein OmpA-like peptidoglycan-associated protein